MGALGIPYAFARAGILLAACVAVVVTGVTIVTVNWTIEVCALANVHHVSAEESDPFLILNKAHNRVRSPRPLLSLCLLFTRRGSYRFECPRARRVCVFALLLRSWLRS